MKPKKTVKSVEKITKSMTLGDVVQKYPEAAMVMMQHGLHCVGCHVAAWETVEQGALGHGMPKKDTDAMLKEMNAAIKKKKS